MCGLAGIISPSGVDPGLLRTMGERLHHRGPDGSGLLVHSLSAGTRIGLGGEDPEPVPAPVAGFAHRRLKIVDLSDAAAQPMSEAGVSLVYNGEVYNHRTLRRELEAEGFTFTSSGDTEVVLKAFVAWGTECFARFEGMWALAILDGPGNRVVLSRDRFGIKPLYTAHAGGNFVFASEIKALLADPRVGRAPNPRTVARYLGLGVLDDGRETFFEAIEHFPAAHWGEVRLDAPDAGLRLRRYWALPDERFAGPADAAVERYRGLFDASVADHLVSDVPSGSCLSGGLDSSAIVCTAAGLGQAGDFTNHTRRAFGFAAAADGADETPYMEAAAEAAGSTLERITVSQQEFDARLPEILAVHDEPVRTASACAQWFVFRRAREAGIRVMLDGQGADETLAGYPGYLLTIARGHLAHGRWQAYRDLSRDYERDIGPFPLSPVRSLGDALLPAFARRRLMARDPVAFSAMTRELAGLAGHDTEADLAPRHSLGRELAADLTTRVLPALLRYEDTNSMAHSIEARVPFLDHRLVAFAMTLPDRLKIEGTRTKAVLRRAMAGVVPDVILGRKDKMAFRQPPAWTFAHARAHASELAVNATEYENRWLDENAVARLIDAGDGDEARERVLWRVINLKYWLRAYSV